MKKQILMVVLLLGAVALQAQNVDYRVVFDMTNKDTSSHKTVIRQASGIAKANPDAKVEVVIYSGALDLVVKDKSIVSKEVENLIKNKQATFKVCAITMARHNIDKSQLSACKWRLWVHGGAKVRGKRVKNKEQGIVK